MSVYFSHKSFELPIFLFFKNVIARCVIAFLLSLSFSYLPKIFMPNGNIQLLFVVMASITSFLVSFYFIILENVERSEMNKVFKSFVRKLYFKNTTKAMI
jgi:uncharacterized membrane protein YjjP (DUF1212 family)